MKGVGGARGQVSLEFIIVLASFFGLFLLISPVIKDGYNKTTVLLAKENARMTLLDASAHADFACLSGPGTSTIFKNEKQYFLSMQGNEIGIEFLFGGETLSLKKKILCGTASGSARGETVRMENRDGTLILYDS